MKKIYYVANFYMPYQKAYAIQLAKMCEAFVEEGVDLTLVVPRRGPRTPLKAFYGLRVDIPTVWLFSLDFESYGRLGYALMAVLFSLSYTVFLLWKWFCGERFIIYTIDADNYASTALTFLPSPLFSEMHGAKPATLAQKILFSRFRGIIAINRIIVEELQEKFPHSTARYTAEPNGVDLHMFAPQDKRAAREKLGLPADTPTVLYAGRFYEWKGLEVIPSAAAESPEVRWQMVGDTKEKFASLVASVLPLNMHFAGGRDHAEMPLWIAAADAAIVLGTKRDEQSYRWTSPMKLFEYMAARRPIIASATPALKEILRPNEAFFYEPDNAQGLARQVKRAVEGGPDVSAAVEVAARAVQDCSWRERARRVIEFIESALNEPLR